MMRHLLIFFIVAFFTAKTVHSQSISLGNNDIAVEIKYAGSTDTVLIVIKNLTKRTVFVSMIDGVNASGKYLGVGLYSSVFPHTPDHLSKYSNNLKLMAINPEDSKVIRQETKINLLEGLDFNLDYALNDQDAKMNRTLYDEHVRFLKLKISK